MMNIEEQMLNQACAFVRCENLTLTRLSIDVFGHGKFFNRLRAGQGVSLRSVNRVIDHFIARGYDPDELARQGAAMRKGEGHAPTMPSSGDAVTAQAAENCA